MLEKVFWDMGNLKAGCFQRQINFFVPPFINAEFHLGDALGYSSGELSEGSMEVPMEWEFGRCSMYQCLSSW